MRFDKKKLPAALLSAFVISLITAYTRGRFDNIGWSDWWPVDWAAVLEILIILAVMAAAAAALAYFFYWLFPPRARLP